jgi:hypothetical protein
VDQTVAVNLTKEELVNWYNQPITQAVFLALQDRIRNVLMSMGDGGYLDSENPAATALSYAKAVGYVAGLRATMTLELENEELDGTESNR